jgi:3-hydroxyisobutyrate dehydrogenase-like beta-hydroxyacid dehydrogenase
MDIGSSTIGWLGTGRMGEIMAGRLIDAGHELAVWNRTPSKAQGLADQGATVVPSIVDLTQCDVVFVIVSTPSVLLQVTLGDEGLLSGADLPSIVVDCSTVDSATSADVRKRAVELGVDYLAAPISGNPRHVAEGESVFAVSGERSAFDRVASYLQTIAREAIWVGPEEESRLVKLCHNLYLGVMVQALSEVTTLAEKSGIPRAAFLQYLGSTVLGSYWVRERTPDMLSLDWTPTFTMELLRKDFDLGLGTAREAEVPMILSATVIQLIQAAIGLGYRDRDFLSLFEIEARSAGMDLQPEPQRGTS